MTMNTITTTAPPEERRCGACGEILVRREGEQTGNWKKRAYCDSTCVSQSRLREDEAKTCVNCGEPLKRRPGEDGWSFARRISCGKDCGNQSRGMTFERICPTCQKNFNVTGTDKGQVYCSRECYEVERGKSLRKPRVTLVCQQCRQEYDVKAYIATNRKGELESKFCSKTCRDANQASRPRPQMTPAREVAICQNPNCGKQ